MKNEITRSKNVLSIIDNLEKQLQAEQQAHKKEVEELYELIANAHDQIIELSKKFGLEQYEHNALREKLKTIQWSGTHVESDRSQYDCCPVCYGTEHDSSFELTQGHTDTCWLHQAIKEDSR